MYIACSENERLYQQFPTVYCPKETKYTLNGKFGATTSKLVLLIFLMPYAFPDAPQSIAIAQTCLLGYEIGKETVAGFDEFSLDNPHCLVSNQNEGIRISLALGAVNISICPFYMVGRFDTQDKRKTAYTAASCGANPIADV